MNPLEEALSALAKDLGELGIAHALVGGLAIGIRTEPRFTRDADVAVSATDRSAESGRDLLSEATGVLPA